MFIVDCNPNPTTIFPRGPDISGGCANKDRAEGEVTACHLLPPYILRVYLAPQWPFTLLTIRAFRMRFFLLHSLVTSFQSGSGDLQLSDLSISSFTSKIWSVLWYIWRATLGIHRHQIRPRNPNPEHDVESSPLLQTSLSPIG